MHSISMELHLLLVFWLFNVLFGCSSARGHTGDNILSSSRQIGSRRMVSMHSKRDIVKQEYIAEVGLGNWADCAYTVMAEIGGTPLPVIVDTGSSDLWVISDACIDNCPYVSNTPRYPQSSFKSSSIDSLLFYGDSASATHAFGLIGGDAITLAGLKLEEQLFSAVNNTNTSVLQMGSSGLLGLGFPTSSIILEKVFAAQQANAEHDESKKWLNNLIQDITKASPGASLANKLSYLMTLGPFVPRLVESQVLTQPMFSITLQRDTIDPGSGNSGHLTLGSMPDNLTESDMTWSNVRLYTPEQGGFQPTPEKPEEVYPRSWEIMIDDVYFDGELLPRTNLTHPSIGMSALIDTGNSYIRGPRDIVEYIFSRVSIPPTPTHSFPCTTSHTLAFKINGTLFPIDPRDIVTQFHTINDIVPDLSCSLTVAATDTPALGQKGPLYSWSLGAPFLKSIKAAFYYGNLTHPSSDPPRIGFSSTVPEDAHIRMRSVAVAAEHRGKCLPVTSEPAPAPSQQPRIAARPKQHLDTQSNSARVFGWSIWLNLVWLCTGWVVVRHIL